MRHGIAALHLFEYEDANEAFRRAQQLESRSALAYWGEAMTYYQTLWRREDVAAGRAALDRLAPSPDARAAAAATPRERALLAAADILFGEGDPADRHRRYAESMGRAYAQLPEDPDVASLYALALLGTMSRGTIGYDAHEGHTEGLAGSDVQRQAAEILRRVLAAHPDHAGALHYLIHDYDDPAHAHLALDAARTLTKLAPDSSHARHMPSHIFLQLGMWRDAAASDRNAYDASLAWVARKNFGPAMRNYHALAWLEYELLQSGKYADAARTIDELEPVVKATGSVTLLSDLASMRARFTIETRRWTTMARANDFANVNDLFAIGLSAARSGDVDRAERVRQALAARVNSEREGDLLPVIPIMEREVAGMTALAMGRRDEAVQMLRAAADTELKLPPPLGLPAPIKPAPELLGEVLLDLGRPREAVGPFEQTLRRSANRSLSVLGAARAAAAVGDRETAKKRYAEFLANYTDADADLPEVAEATAAATTTGRLVPIGAAMTVAAAAAAAAAVVVVVRRGRRRRSTKKELRSKKAAVKKKGP